MYAETIKFKDYNGNDRTETAWFHLNKAEVIDMQMAETGGLDAALQTLIDKKDIPAIMKFFKDFIAKAYGERDPDGVHFNKSEEISRRFAQTEAYSELYMKLCFDAEAAAKFVNGVLPANLKGDLEKYVEAAQTRTNEAVAPVAAPANATPAN